MDEDISLPADTLIILNQFLEERSQHQDNEKKCIIDQTGRDVKFEEDWQLSQFWYSDHTKRTIGDVVAKLLSKENETASFNIALLSCPSLYATIKDIHKHVQIFEYDRRFAAYGTDFVFYDFNAVEKATEYLQTHQKRFDLIIADPPFLSEECISKMSRIIQNLQRNRESMVILCSGEIVEPWLTACLDVHKCQFRPEHERNLGNNFISYANFNLDQYIENK